MSERSSTLLVLGALAAGAIALVALKRRRDRPIVMAESAAGDVEALARVITSEAGTGSAEEQRAIAWAVVNQARARRVSIVRLVCSPECGPCCDGRPFSSAQPATLAARDLARRVLAEPDASDPTRGARKFFEPALQDKLAHRPPAFNLKHRLTAADVRAKWAREGRRAVGTVGRFEFWV
jgi:hypothetical protein